MSTSRPAALIAAGPGRASPARPRRSGRRTPTTASCRSPQRRSHSRSSALEGGQGTPAAPVLRRPDDQPTAPGARRRVSSWARRSAARDSSGRSSRSVRGEPVTQMLGRDGEPAARRMACGEPGRRDDGARQVDVVHRLVVGRSGRRPARPRGRAERQQTRCHGAARRTGGPPRTRGGGCRPAGPGSRRWSASGAGTSVGACSPSAPPVTLAPPRRGEPGSTISTFLIAGSWRTASNTARAFPSSRWRGRIHEEGPPVVEPRRPALVLVEVVRRAPAPACATEPSASVWMPRARCRLYGGETRQQVALDRVDVGARGERRARAPSTARGRARRTGSRAGTGA